jgi:hypothetical protein
MDNSNNIVSSTLTDNIVINKKTVKSTIINGSVDLTISEGEIEIDNSQIITPTTTAKLNGTNLEDITILNDEGEPTKIIKKVGNTYYLTRNISWYEIQQVTSISHFIELYDGETFDGNGFTIDLVSNSTEGLFLSKATSVEKSVTIKNLGVLNGSLYNTYRAYIVRQYSHYFIVDNCYVTGDINTNYSGGIVSSYCCYGVGKSGIVRNCYHTGNLITNYTAGILASYVGYDSGKIEVINCYSSGEITGSYSAGINGVRCGYNNGLLIIKDCISFNKLNGNYCSGFIGHRSAESNRGTVIIQNSYFCGSLGENNPSYCGGFATYYAPDNGGILIIQNCYSTLPINNNNSGPIITTLVDIPNSYMIAFQMNYGNVEGYENQILNIDSYTTKTNTNKPNYNISDIFNSLGRINEATEIINYSYYNANHPLFNSYGITVRNEGGAYILDDEYPLLKSFIDSPAWNTTNYNNYNNKPELLNGSILPKQTNFTINGCDLQFDLVIPDELYSSVSKITIEALDTDLSNSYNVSLTSNTYSLLLKNTTYTNYNILIKVYDEEGYYVVQPHKLITLNIKPDGMKVSSFNTIIAENDTTELSYQLTATNPTGGTIRYELMIGNDLFTSAYSYDGSFGLVSFDGKDRITYKPKSKVYGREIIQFISREVETNIPSVPGSIDIYIDASPVSSDKYININQGDTTSVVFDALDPQDGAFNVNIVKQPTKGTMTKVNDLTYTYVSNGTDFGEDSIGYTLSDNYTTTETYYAYIQINSASNTLSQALDGSYTCERGQSIYINLYSTDANADRATYKISSRPENGYLNKYYGVMTLDLNRNYKGTLVYTAAQDFSGVDVFKFVVDDGVVKSLEGTISINCINTVPEAKDVNIETIQNVEKQLLLNGLDLNRDSLVYTYNQPTNGTITSIYGKYVTYKPNTDFVGNDSFTYTVSDGYSTSNVATVNIVVEGLSNKLTKLQERMDNELPNLPRYKKKKFEDDIKDDIINYSDFTDLLKNYSRMIYKYRQGAIVDVSNELNVVESVKVDTEIKKGVRKALRKQLNDFGYSNLRLITSEQKNNIINAANSVAPDINPVVYQKEIVSLVPNPDDISNGNIPVYNLDETNLDSQNLYFDIADQEKIKLNFDGEIREFTYVVEKDANNELVDDYLEDAEGNIYRAGDNIVLGKSTLFVLALGSVMISNGDVSSSSGDPYITTLTKQTYKMKEQPGIYRMFDGENLIINAEVDWISENHKEKILDYFNYLPNVVTRGILYKYLYIENEGEKLVVDFVNRKVHTNTENASISVGEMYNDYSQSPFYKTIKCKKIPIMIKNKSHGYVRLTIELYENPQIDSGLSIQVEKYKMNEITGLLVDTFKEKDMKVETLDNIESLRHNSYETEEKKHIIEKHETWYYMK